MSQHRRGHFFDVVGRNKVLAAQARQCPAHLQQSNRSAWAGAQLQMAKSASRSHNLIDIFQNRRFQLKGVETIAALGQLSQTTHRLETDLGEVHGILPLRKALQNGQFVSRAGVIHQHFEHKAIQLRFR